MKQCRQCGKDYLQPYRHDLCSLDCVAAYESGAPPHPTFVERVTNRVFKGMMFGADDALIRTQLVSEGVDATTIARVLDKARGTYKRLQQRGMLAPDPNPCVDMSCLNR